MRYRIAIKLLEPLLLGEYWRCNGASNEIDESTKTGARQGGYMQGRMSVIEDLLEKKTLPWMNNKPNKKAK